MRCFAVLIFLVSAAAASVGRNVPAMQRFNGPDRTITWKAWHQNPKREYRFRTGDRYLGHRVWEHYLLFEEAQSSDKSIKFSMVHLAREDGLDDVVIRPALRYAIFKVTNGNMTAHKGVWSWTAQELKHVFEKKRHLVAVN
jgi:hypothetical protein